MKQLTNEKKIALDMRRINLKHEKSTHNPERRGEEVESVYQSQHNQSPSLCPFDERVTLITGYE